MTEGIPVGELEALRHLLLLVDQADEWPTAGKIRFALAGAIAMGFYHVRRRTREITYDVDAILLSSNVPADLLASIAERRGLSFRAGGVAWLPYDWEDRIVMLPWEFHHLEVGYLDPYDWVVTKLGRWLRHDRADAVAVARTLDPARLVKHVRRALPDYVGNPRSVRLAWSELARDLGWTGDYADLG
jgi:hypothetical protein